MLRIEIFNINISVSGNLWKTMPEKQTKVGHCFLISRVKWKELYKGMEDSGIAKFMRGILHQLGVA